MVGGKSRREKPSKDICGDSCSEIVIIHFIPLNNLVFMWKGVAQETCKHKNDVCFDESGHLSASEN